MINSIIVLGSGSAGLLAALTLKKKVPGISVTIVRSMEIGVIGVGEGTTAFMPSFLHGYLGIDMGDFFRDTRPTFKVGIRFEWGRRPGFNYTFTPQFVAIGNDLSKSVGFYCDGDVDFVSLNSALMAVDRAFVRTRDGMPDHQKNVAYHLENATLVQYLNRLAVAAGIAIEEDTIEAVEQDESAVRAIKGKSGRRYAADLFVDCSGFASTLLGKAVEEPFIDFGSSLFCDRAVVGGWDRTPADVLHPYTLATTMSAGWSWRIEHESRVNRGYVYSSAFTTDEKAEAEFRRENPLLADTRVLKFTTGRRGRMWVKNVVGIGNAVGFVEPLEATSLTLICEQSKALANTLIESDRDPGPQLIRRLNDFHARKWNSVRSFLALHYKFNDRSDSPFWRHCRADTDLASAENFVEYFQENGPTLFRLETLFDPIDAFGAEGYLCMMIGMRVPHRRAYVPTPREAAAWNRHTALLRDTAANGVSVEESLAILRNPAIQIQPGFYSAG